MSQRLLIFLSACALMSGCLAEDKFVEKSIEADCLYRQACLPEAVLTFNNWTDTPTCHRDARDFWEDLGAADGCEYDKKTAKACLKALEDQAISCPGDELTIPDVCFNSFETCSSAEPDTTGDDTGATEDSGA